MFCNDRGVYTNFNGSRSLTMKITELRFSLVDVPIWP